MKILAAGDFHGDSALATSLAEMAEKENAELVVLCGDITHKDQHTEYLVGPFRSRGLNVLFVPGNHDSFATAGFLTDMYNLKNLHGRSVRYNHAGFFGAGGANVGVEQLTDQEFLELLNYGHEKISYLDKKVMVTHVHPAKTQMEKFSSFFSGSHGVRKAAENLAPDILLCSHVHEAEGIEEKIGSTRVINVGRKGKLLDI